MTTQAIGTTIFASSHPDITRRTSVSGLIFSCVMLLAGVIAFVSTFGMGDRSSAVSMGFMVPDTTLFLVRIFRLFWKSEEIVYLPTGSVAKEQSIFSDLKHLDGLIDMVKSGDFSLQSTAEGGTSGNLRLDVMLSEGKRLAAVQLLRFVPYTYNPITSVRYSTNSETASIVTFLTKIKGHWSFNSSPNISWGSAVDDGYPHFLRQEISIHILCYVVSGFI